jgi:hypothetical protein
VLGRQERRFESHIVVVVVDVHRRRQRGNASRCRVGRCYSRCNGGRGGRSRNTFSFFLDALLLFERQLRCKQCVAFLLQTLKQRHYKQHKTANETFLRFPRLIQPAVAWQYARLRPTSTNAHCQPLASTTPSRRSARRRRASMMRLFVVVKVAMQQLVTQMQRTMMIQQ